MLFNPPEWASQPCRIASLEASFGVGTVGAIAQVNSGVARLLLTGILERYQPTRPQILGSMQSLGTQTCRSICRPTACPSRFIPATDGLLFILWTSSPITRSDGKLSRCQLHSSTIRVAACTLLSSTTTTVASS